ncbi:ester cyclase [Pantoea sp. Tr-811]|uniref:ester cyclase n=1 Tax=Pantoea sp. Tr-811 TaxID=2608361 RepID=UPI0014240AE1|nr:nuclear transport factor 2 family protein [Pantoea sp. Tr-811]NIF29481.1 ester cyclase [Pantoea sp. Tr-811]
MTTPEALVELFSKWEKVWHDKAYDLAPQCVADHYTRHDEGGSRTVTRDAYLTEMKAVHRDRPDIRVVVFDHDFGMDRAWFRFMFKWSKDGEIITRAGMQTYRINDGKIAETWIAMQPVGSTWEETPQPTWIDR